MDIRQQERVIVALDGGMEESLGIAKRLSGRATWVKVGMTLYYAQGPSAVAAFKELGFKVFLDLKLHDIPHQVRGAAAALVESGADMVTVHAGGGAEMMAAAREGALRAAARTGAEPPIMLGVTVLTSMDDAALASVGVSSPPAEQVARLARLVKDSGLTGVVCSPREAAAMRALLGADAAVVTPGIRPSWACAGDQKRIATPRDAFAAGASHIVIGRPVTQADDPAEAFARLWE